MKILPIATSALTCMLSSALQADPAYTIQRLGLTDNAHTRSSDGFQYSGIYNLNQSGQATGIAQRYNDLSATIGYSAWLYNGNNTIEIGLTDAAHTSNTGYQDNRASYLNDAGQVAGTANRYNGSTGMGSSAWLYNGTNTFEIGLTDATHTRNDGYQTNYVNRLNQAGQVIGSAQLFNGSTSIGSSAWLYNGTVTLEIGLTDAAHTHSNGLQFNTANQLNEAGQVLGQANRYNGTSAMGTSIWLYNGVNTIEIGLTDATHTRDDGYQYNYAYQLNQAGQVAGTANRYNGSTGMGSSAWLYNGTNTIEIGLNDAQHTRSDGYQVNNTAQINDAGQVTGVAKRYSGSSDMGQSSWLYNGTNTIEIGLTDAAHTRDDGYQYNYAYQLNQAGQVIGGTQPYNGSTIMGSSAWLYNGANTIEIGLTDAAHTNGNGYQSNNARHLNEAGQVAGVANRYNGNSDMGQSAWFYNGTDTIEIGLTDANHTYADGWQHNSVTDMNELGQVAGYACRNFGFDSQYYCQENNRQPGASTYFSSQSAWLYDSLLNQTFDLTFSERDDGYAYSEITYLGDNGIALGWYKLFDGATSLGERAFYFSSSEGFFDLGSIVSNLDDAGWASLAYAIRSNDAGYITGKGMIDGKTGVFLLTPQTSTVPVPTAAWLFGSGLLGLIGVGARRQHSNA